MYGPNKSSVTGGFQLAEKQLLLEWYPAVLLAGAVFWCRLLVTINNILVILSIVLIWKNTPPLCMVSTLPECVQISRTLWSQNAEILQ